MFTGRPATMAGMENFYRPPGDEPRDSLPTEQFWHSPGIPGPHQGSSDPGYGHHWQQQPGLQAHLARDRHKALRWTVGLTVAVVLAAGGVIAGISLAGNSLPSTPSTPTASTGSTGSGTTGTGGTGTTGTGTAGQDGQAALLDATLSAASSPAAAVSAAVPAAVTAGSAPGAGAGAPAADPAVRRCVKAAQAARTARLTGHSHVANTARVVTARCRALRRRLVRLFLLRGVDGQFTIRTRTGALKTLAYERGVIQSVSSGNSIVVKAADGTVWTWDLVSKTVVRDRNGKISESSLAAGQPVWVGGPVISGAKDARLIFVRPPVARPRVWPQAGGKRAAHGAARLPRRGAAIPSRRLPRPRPREAVALAALVRHDRAYPAQPCPKPQNVPW
jgi:hypothetical protein